MIDIVERSSQYASDKMEELFSKAIAQAYADGYRDGYYNHQEEIANTNTCEIEFVDLGLPSGTKWSFDFKRKDNEIEYLSYQNAISWSIPTEEQWNELQEVCKWEYDLDGSRELVEARCIGPNGNYIRFEAAGMMRASSLLEGGIAMFWIKDSKNEKKQNEENTIRIYYGGTYNRRRGLEMGMSSSFAGFKMPIRIVNTI